MKIKKLSDWSKAVKARDGKCQKCGSEHDLHAHHIKPKASHPELSLDLNNGVTLCYRCHKAEHETNRPIRIRSVTPQRRTLIKKISDLEDQLIIADTLNGKKHSIISELEKKIKSDEEIIIYLRNTIRRLRLLSKPST